MKYFTSNDTKNNFQYLPKEVGGFGCRARMLAAGERSMIYRYALSAFMLSD